MEEAEENVRVKRQRCKINIEINVTNQVIISMIGSSVEKCGKV